jgi:hypothetical protein
MKIINLLGFVISALVGWVGSFTYIAFLVIQWANQLNGWKQVLGLYIGMVVFIFALVGLVSVGWYVWRWFRVYRRYKCQKVN